MIKPSKPNRTGYIYCNGVFAGVLHEYTDLKSDRYTYTYDDAYLADGAAIGYRFPLKTKTFEFTVFPPFFANLVSEGWLRTHQAKKARVDKADSFGLLLANGKSLIGAISVLNEKAEV